MKIEEKVMKSIVITGSSSGIGKATAKYFASQGWKVAATMRKPEHETELNQLDNISLYTLDVTDDASVATIKLFAADVARGNVIV